ncbi:putative ribonuclease H-like domain-containing protein [Tanacetum coccineum]
MTNPKKRFQDELPDGTAQPKFMSLTRDKQRIVDVLGIGGSLAVVAAMHSRTHCFEVKLMDLEPYDPYAKTAKRVAVLAEEQRKTAKKEKLDNKRQHTQDVAGPSSYSSQPRSKRSNIRKRSVDTSSSHTISEVHNSENEGRKICISEGIVLQGLPPDVYSLVNHWQAAKDIWDRQVQVNTKFLNTLQPEWSKFMTDVKLAKNIYTTNYDQLYAYLSQHEGHANEVRMLRERYLDPLAFATKLNHTPPSVPHNAYHNPPISQQPQAEFPQLDSGLVVPSFLSGDDPIACLNKAMAFMSIVMASRFPSTNNQLRTSSNLRNQATIQDGRVTVQQVQGRQGQSFAVHKAKEAKECYMVQGKDVAGSGTGIWLDYDDISSAKAVLMANLSSYDSDVLSEGLKQWHGYAVSSLMDTAYWSSENDQGLGSTSGIRACALRNFDLEVMEFESAQNNTTAKLPILKLENGNSWVSVHETSQEGNTSVTKITVPVTAEEKLCKKNDVKARSLLFMVLPNEHQLTFSQYTDAKTLFAAIETRFGGNEATKKTQKALLKLAILGVVITPEDLNSKFLRSLPPEWNTHVVVWMNKANIETLSIDDFTISTKNVNTANPDVSTVSTNINTASPKDDTATLSDATVYAFLANQPKGSQLIHEDLEQIHDDDLEEMDLKWQLALLSMRARRFYQRTGKKITISGSDTTGFDKSKVECFNCHKMGHFARECRNPRNQDSRGRNHDTWNRNQDSSKRTVNVEDASEKAMFAIDGVGFDQSDMAEEQVQTNMALMSFSDSKDQEKMLETEIMIRIAGLDEFKDPESNKYGPRDTVLESTIDCDKESDNSKKNTDDSLEKELIRSKRLEDKLPQCFPAFHEARHSVTMDIYHMVQLFYGNNFVMATMCFEKAGDTLWETLAKASGLRASAYRILETNHEAFEGYVREAAGMFESIGKIELAASCYCDLKEYERAAIDLQIIKPIKSSVTSLCVTSNDNILVGCFGGMIRKIDMRTRRQRQSGDVILNIYEGHQCEESITS